MSDEMTLPTTQRAYTLRLRGIDKCDGSWRDALWATHEAVNKGAKVFGDWLLMLRGGLDHKLADVPVKEKNDKTRPPTDAELRDRRILLALSWLSVEDAYGAPRDESLLVANATDSADCRTRKLGDALAAILKARGVADSELGNPNMRAEDQPRTWLGDCMSSLSAAIRDKAVWVNRSAAFDAAAQQCSSLTRDEIWDFLEPFFANAESYLRSERTDPDDEGDVGVTSKEDKAKDLVQKAGGWLSRRMGAGGGADFERMSRAYEAIAAWAKAGNTGDSGEKTLATLATHLSGKGFSPSADNAQGVLSVISGPGYKSATQNHVTALNNRASVTKDDMTKLVELATADAEKCNSKIGAKGQRPYSGMIIQQVEAACGFTYLQPDGPARHREFSVMLDHAARRVNVAHSWIKNAEAERRQFEDDAQRLGNVPPKALGWLRQYCEERAGTSGSLDAYRIRKRAIDGWDKVVDRWSRADCQTADDRTTATRQLQDDPDDKFGDIQLFEALAAEDALCVWKSDGKPSPQPLKDFVAATDAEAKQKRFKVPAYRHPDPLRHPVFCDFGNSRWGIDFSAHRAPAKRGEQEQKVQKLSSVLAEAERKQSSAREMQREARQAKVVECRDKLRRAEQEFEVSGDHHRLELRLWNGQAVKPIPLRWSCKRLVADLALRSTKGASRESQTDVPRADRLGRAAVRANGSSDVNITGLFQQAHWNGRLQAPRAQLDAIARHVDKHGWDAKAQKLVERIRWLVSFSAELTQLGPWKEYCDRFGDDAPAKPFISRKGEYAVKHRNNERRKGHAKLILSRLPGLRVLSVDLGHRYAAACALWEAITQEQMEQACTNAGVAPPDANAMYVHLHGTNTLGRPTTTIYRRIGPDMLPDKAPHPAPWARLDRQFLIKLQGEDRAARKASSAEIEAVEQFEQWTGRIRSDNDPARELAVDILMSDAVRTARLALARHGRRARIAHHLTATTRTLPGARQQQLDAAGRLELLTDTLADWHALATDSRWNDAATRQLWNDRLAGLTRGFAIHLPQQQPPKPGEQTKAQRRHAEQALRQQLQPLAQTLSGDEAVRQELHDTWAVRWQTEDDQWCEKLRWLAGWLMPRHLSRVVEVVKKNGGRVKRRKPIHEAVASASNVGGLSLTRIATLTEFRRKVQVGYFTRLKPDCSRAEIGPAFGQSTLDTIQRLKDQRVKQLASRIVEAALGVGIERRGENGCDLPRPHRRSDDPRFAVCHAVVIEDLSHYRPEETRTRRENRATMDWKSAETRKRLADHCQLYGLYLRDVNPQYTSRQDSRTGAPGVRCVDVQVAEFLAKPWWRKQVAHAQKKALENKGDARDGYLLAIEDRWSTMSDEKKAQAKPLRIPLAGGELFVSADPRSSLADGIQADLNAAANIGLRALLDPDWPGRWWYVPAILSDDGFRVTNADKCSGALCLEGWKVAKVPEGYSAQGKPLRLADEQDIKQAQTEFDQAEGILKAAKDELKNAKRGKAVQSMDEAIRKVEDADAARKLAKNRLNEVKKAAKAKFYINLWRDPAAAPLSSGSWFEYSEYGNKVRYRVIQILRPRAELPREDGDKARESS